MVERENKYSKKKIKINLKRNMFFSTIIFSLISLLSVIPPTFALTFTDNSQSNFSNKAYTSRIFYLQGLSYGDNISCIQEEYSEQELANNQGVEIELEGTR